LHYMNFIDIFDKIPSNFSPDRTFYKGSKTSSTIIQAKGKTHQ
jgi:hypothetical protein